MRVYLSAPFSSEQRLPQQLRREDAANVESGRGDGGETKRSKLNCAFREGRHVLPMETQVIEATKYLN